MNYFFNSEWAVIMNCLCYVWVFYSLRKTPSPSCDIINLVTITLRSRIKRYRKQIFSSKKCDLFVVSSNNSIVVQIILG